MIQHDGQMPALLKQCLRFMNVLSTKRGSFFFKMKRKYKVHAFYYSLSGRKAQRALAVINLRFTKTFQ